VENLPSGDRRSAGGASQEWSASPLYGSGIGGAIACSWHKSCCTPTPFHTEGPFGASSVCILEHTYPRSTGRYGVKARQPGTSACTTSTSGTAKPTYRRIAFHASTYGAGTHESQASRQLCALSPGSLAG